MKKSIIVVSITLLITNVYAQENRLRSGPMLGYVDFREACVWVQAEKPGIVKVRYWRHPDTVYESASSWATLENHLATKLLLTDIEPGSTYTYELWQSVSLIDNYKKINAKKTYTLKVPALWKWRTEPPAFRFAFGSCHYSNEPVYDRPGTPYGDTDQRIFNTIVSKNPELMLWLGDNIYLREPDWNTKTGIYKRYTHMRSNPALQELLAYCPNYAIWDDHDFGPNDADRSFWNKATTLQAFKDFWANPGYGVNGQPGITTSFEWADAAFFQLDDRYNKTPNESTDSNKTILGADQKQWLLDNLLSTTATFKFVAVGGQFLNTAPKYENFANYAKERKEIIDFIRRHKIKNVIFLTGDRHHSEITKMEGDSVLPAIYDITSSPLTSGAGNSAKYETNEWQVPGSLIMGQRNFTTIDIAGPRKERVLTVTYFDNAGAELFKYVIKAE